MAPSAFSQNQWVCVIKDVEVVKGTLGIELLLTGQGHLICIFCLKAVWNEKKKKKKLGAWLVRDWRTVLS